MLIPIYDHNPVDRKPIVTYTIIGLNIAIWIFGQGAGMVSSLYARSICQFGLVSGDLLGLVSYGQLQGVGRGIACVFDGQPAYYTLITHMFLHGGWGHIFFNMLFLWIFGDNIENALGRVRFVIFYLLCGLVAAGAEMLTNLGSTVPMVGASGAISGVLGAYILLHPRARIRVLLFFFIPIETPAVFILGSYFLIQLMYGLFGGADNIAYWAHIGGFLAGLALVNFMKKREQKFTLNR
ncbi:MAG: rhomboid family intramembrane serine protease [Gammaproteobacteria bacterium]|nr:rhomboid family intramembrane serine protease [Gammaproteobacteria bacterium]MYF37478.1 rhomboid family intramembrane serine protease [Gammaproteobacteria bacterium]